jgi:hypothetical protein
MERRVLAGARVPWIGGVPPADFQCRAEFSQRLYVNEDNTKPQTENKTHFDCRH